MNNFELVETIRAYCTANGIIFKYGPREVMNVLLGNEAYEAGQLVLLCSFDDTPTIVNGVVQAIDYVGFLSLGRKCETTTSADLDETRIQKYDRRLSTLKQLLMSTITTIMCENELEVLGVTFEERVNETDENLDFIHTPITFIQ